MRVATRRLRAFLRSARQCPRPRLGRAAAEELHWLGGPARPGPRPRRPARLPAPEAELEGEASARPSCRSSPSSRRSASGRWGCWRGSRASATRPPRPVEAAAAPAGRLPRGPDPSSPRSSPPSLRKLRRALALDAAVQRRELHDARIRTKRARYAAELAAPALGRAGRRVRLRRQGPPGRARRAPGRGRRRGADPLARVPDGRTRGARSPPAASSSASAPGARRRGPTCATRGSASSVSAARRCEPAARPPRLGRPLRPVGRRRRPAPPRRARAPAGAPRLAARAVEVERILSSPCDTLRRHGRAARRGVARPRRRDPRRAPTSGRTSTGRARPLARGRAVGRLRTAGSRRPSASTCRGRRARCSSSAATWRSSSGCGRERRVPAGGGRLAWRAAPLAAQHHGTSSGIWLVTYKKGDPRYLPYEPSSRRPCASAGSTARPQSRRAPHLDRADATEASEQLVGPEQGARRAARRGRPHGARRTRGDRAGKGRRHLGRGRRDLRRSPPRPRRAASAGRGRPRASAARRARPRRRETAREPCSARVHRGADERPVAVVLELVARVDVEALPVELRDDERSSSNAVIRDSTSMRRPARSTTWRERADAGLGVERVELARAADPAQHQLGLDEPCETRSRGASISTVCSLRSIGSADGSGRAGLGEERQGDALAEPAPAESELDAEAVHDLGEDQRPGGRTRARSTSIPYAPRSLRRAPGGSARATSSSRSPSRRPTSFAIARAPPADGEGRVRARRQDPGEGLVRGPRGRGERLVDGGSSSSRSRGQPERADVDGAQPGRRLRRRAGGVRGAAAHVDDRDESPSSTSECAHRPRRGALVLRGQRSAPARAWRGQLVQSSSAFAACRPGAATATSSSSLPAARAAAAWSAPPPPPRRASPRRSGRGGGSRPPGRRGLLLLDPRELAARACSSRAAGWCWTRRRSHRRASRWP